MDQEKRSMAWISSLLVVATLLVGFFIVKDWPNPGHASESYQELQIFSEVLMQVKKHYVEEPVTKELVQGAIRGMLATLDPHSSYMTADMYEEMQVETKGQFGGLGIQIGIKNNHLTVIAPIEDTPAFLAGILAGDMILKVDDKPTKDLTLMEAVHNMRGSKGTTVTLTIERKGVDKSLMFTLTRDTIKIHSVRKKVLDNQIGYIRISQFQEATPDDLAEALGELEQEHIQSLILDLRNNPGGLLTAAVGVSEQFLESDKLVVSIKARDGKKDEYRARLGHPPSRYPMIVLVNEGSASASEIVAAALQDWGKAVIIGKTTFGKGSVQTIVPLSDGSGLRLTTAKYYTPRGKSIHSIGVKPDIVVDAKPLPVSQRASSKTHKPAALSSDVSEGQGAEEERVSNGDKITEPESSKTDDSQRSLNDVQLQKAIELLQTWKVFKGLQPL